MTDKRPERGTAEYERWRTARSKARANELLCGKASPPDQLGNLSGNQETMREASSDNRSIIRIVK